MGVVLCPHLSPSTQEGHQSQTVGRVPGARSLWCSRVLASPSAGATFPGTLGLVPRGQEGAMAVVGSSAAGCARREANLKSLKKYF